jgi:hypothetical protein
MPWWIMGAAEWEYAMEPLMYSDYVMWPTGKTKLRWEGEEPGYLYCSEEAFGCFEVVECDGTKMKRAAVYFDYDKYLSLGSNERIAVSAHEWGHNLNLGDIPARYFCTNPPRIMAAWGPDGVGCITGPSPEEVQAVADFYSGPGDTDGDGIRDFEDPTPDHDVGVGCFFLGPSPVRISDYQGRYMWAVCEIRNYRGHTESVEMEFNVGGAPTGCWQDLQLVLPGSETFEIAAWDSKWALYRARYDCHAPAVPGVYTLTTILSIDHIDPGGHGDETSEDQVNNTRLQYKSLIVQSN